jgi:RNA polymerase sigma-70 factor (ECF subfamily)
MNSITTTDELLLAAEKVAVEDASSARATADGSLSDHRLLEAARAGDDAAFAEIVNRYRNPITNYVFRLLDDYETAVDLAQETFVRVYGALERYQMTHAFSTYIYSIATNLAITELRKRKRRRVISLNFLWQESGADEASREFDPPDAQPLQDAALVETERQRAVARAIATLPDKYRAPLVLRDIEERSYEEIAQILALNEGTVKSRINRARALLREKLRTYL